MSDLTNEQINYLFDFVKSKNVPHLDTQCEIVDHLACAVEDLRSTKSHLSFETALEMVYKRFPITGFALLQLEKEKVLKRFWRRRFWTYLMHFVTPPKIILSIAIFLLFSFFFNSVGDLIRLDDESNKYIAGVLILFFYVFSFFFFDRYMFYEPKEDKSDYLVIQTYKQEGTIINYILILTPLFFWCRFSHDGDYLIRLTGIYNYLISFIYTCGLILSYCHHAVFPKMLEEEIELKYAHLDIELA